LKRKGLWLSALKPVNLAIHEKNGSSWRNTKRLAIDRRRRGWNEVHIRGFDPA
jgi:hypothetical protein